MAEDIFNTGNISTGIGFGGASILDTRNYTDDEFIDSLVELVKSVLRDIFRDKPQKQSVVKTTTGLNFACPFCGDSASHASRKRGHMIMTGKYKGHYKCFNCGQYMSISAFMRKWHKELSIGQIDYLSKNTSKDYKTCASSSFTESGEIDMDTVRNLAVNRQALIKYGLKPVSNHTPAGRYLAARLQFDFENYMYNDKGKWLVILNRIDQDNVIGFQVRDMTGRRKNKYMTMTLSKIHDSIVKDGAVVPVWLDNISTTFNLFRININRPVIVTEGPFDANLLPNAIALSGANKSSGGLPDDLYYMYDDDDTGRKIAVKMLDKGYKVFLWSRFKNDYSLPYRKKWDANDVLKYFSEKGVRTIPRWLDYFSDNPLDCIDI